MAVFSQLIQDEADDSCHGLIRYAVGQSLLGSVLVASSAKGVVLIQIGDDADELVDNLRRRFPSADVAPADDDYGPTLARVIDFVEAPRAWCRS